MSLKDLTNVHSRRNTKWVQDDVNWSSVGKEWHIFRGHNSRDNSLVTVASCHLVTNHQLSLLGNVNLNGHVRPGRKLIARDLEKWLFGSVADQSIALLRLLVNVVDRRREVLVAAKDFNVNNRSLFTVRNSERYVPGFFSLLTKDRDNQSLFSGHFYLTLRSNLTNENVFRSNFSTDSDNSVLVEVLQSIFTDVRNVASDFLRSELGVNRFGLVALDVDRGVNVVLNNSITNEDRVLIVVTVPRHKRDNHVLTKSELSVVNTRSVGKGITLQNVLTKANHRSLSETGRLVRLHHVHQMINV